jgi:hypothetical protein
MPLPRTLHIGGYWRGPNDMVRHMMLGLRAAGAEVREYNTDEHPEALDTEGRPYDRGRFGPVWLRREVLDPVIADFRPELIVCNAGGLSFRPDHARELALEAMLLGIALSDPDVFAPATSRIAANFHLFLTNAAALLGEYAARGAHAAPLPLATNEEYFRPAPPREDLRCEVLMVGRASPDRVEPVRELARQFALRVCGEGWQEHGVAAAPAVYGDELAAALNSAGVTVVFSRTPAGHPIPKVAVFDFLATGALVATEPIPAITEYLDPGVDFVPFTDAGELAAALRAVLADPERAGRIRAAGRAKVLSRYTWRAVWPGMIAAVEAAAAGSRWVRRARDGPACAPHAGQGGRRC